MSVKPEIRSQLETLRIAEAQRPARDRTAASRRSPWGRVAAVLLLLLLAGGGGLYAIRSGWGGALLAATAPAAEVPTITVTTQTERGPRPVLTATGKIVSDHRVLVATKVSGQIVELFFEQGDAVKQGQLIARIEDVNYRARRDEAQAMLEKARANLDYQKVNYPRVERLHQAGRTSSDIELAEARRALDEAQAQVTADEASLVWAQKALDDCQVLAPIAGVILERNVEVGDFVAAEGGRGAIANALFASIADMSKLRVEVDVSELDITRLGRDMQCVVTPEAYKDRRYQGHVMWLDPGANYSKATVQVKVRIEEPDDYLRVEGSAKVEFLGSTDSPDTSASPPATARGIWIPASACLVDPEGKSGKVFTVSANRLAERGVKLGARLGDQLEIIEGLAPGERIASRDLDKLTDGQRIKVAGSR